jgi:mannosylglycoprotein endo-beta-mannosidase
MADLEPLVASVGKRAAPWQGRFMSSAARLTLIDACLSNLPLHTMGLFLLADGTHAAMDRHRNRFFWEGQGTSKKFHMVNWRTICQPKSQGGLGVLNTKLMNIALIAKWIWRIYRAENSDLLWLRLLRAKYRISEIFSYTPTSCSPFWHSIHKVKEFFRAGTRFFPGKNSKISFWKDLWIGEVPLCARFPTLFAKSSDIDLTMAQAYSEEGWRILFRRALDQGDLQAWSELSALVEDIELEDVPTTISWSLNPSGQFSTKSLYLSLCKAPEVPITKLIWKCQLPLKLKIFTWQLLKGRLPSSDHIHAWGGASDGKRVLCGKPEDVDHIFFQCHLAEFLWSGVRAMFRVNWNPRNRQDWITILNSLAIKPCSFGARFKGLRTGCCWTNWWC